MFKPKQLGFTLVELMIVVSIIAILAAIGMPSYRAWIENTKIRSGAQSILNGIQKARAFAVQNNTQVRFTLVGTNSAWSVGCVNTVVCPDPIEARASSDGSSTSVTVAPTPSAVTTITFSNLGIANTGGLTQVDVDTTAISSGKRPLSIRIGASGAARLCDPAFSLPDPKGC